MQFEPEPEDEWQAHCRNAVAMAEGETAPEEPVMAGEVVRVEAEAESEPVVAGEVVPEVMEREAPAEGSTRGSVEFLGRWNEKVDDRAMPLWTVPITNYRGEFIRHQDFFEDLSVARTAFGRLVDELMQKEAPSGLFAISTRNGPFRGQQRVRLWGFSWSTSPEDTTYQRHGAVDEVRLEAQLAAAEAKKSMAFADFEGVVDDLRDEDQITVYRVTLPSGGLDPDKWVGRPPPPAPEDLCTGPRSDGLLSTDEISGEYSAACICTDICRPIICNSITVVPHGPDAIETWRTGCCFLPCLGCIGPFVGGEVRTRDPGTNGFGHWERDCCCLHNRVMTFSADGTANQGDEVYKKRPSSQKRTFQKVDARDLAGKWRGCACIPFVPCTVLFSPLHCTTKKALNEDQYDEWGDSCFLCFCPQSEYGGDSCALASETRTRKYVNGHPTNGFATDGNPENVRWHRDPGCTTGAGHEFFFEKKLC